jgi:arginine decarboxylase
MGWLDLGGGLAVDYEGSQTNGPSSRNYSVEEYCADVVEGVMEVCASAEVAPPHLVTESGRATIAHYGALVFSILDVNELSSSDSLPAIPEESPLELQHLAELKDVLSSGDPREILNDAAYYRDAVRSRFTLGLAGLRERALAERYFSFLVRTLDTPEEPGDHTRPDIYYGNFSLFQSLPDTWAIDQLFPIMPLHRLNECPDREGIFADITCDCDGKIDRFFGPDGITSSLPLHRVSPEEPYYIGVFLVGAYQETLGDLHNLFGDTNVVSVSIDDQGRRVYGHEVEGDTVADVLSYVEFDPKDLTAQFRALAEQAVREKRITAEQRRIVMAAYTEGMRGYTYFEAE